MKTLEAQRPNFIGWVLIALSASYLFIMVFLPLFAALGEASKLGWEGYWKGLSHPNTLSALGLTLLTSAVVIPINVVLGLFAAWALAKFRFPGRSFLITLLDLPFSISPIIVGFLFVLVYGKYGLLGPLLDDMGFQIIFSWPALVLTTTFVTFPFIVRELLPTMEELGNEEEEAAITLGASGWQTFWKVTLPNIKWALLYGAVLANARAMGEFGAASVVSGFIRGKTVTLPLSIEIAYNEFQMVQAFSAATLFVLFAVLTLVLKLILGRLSKRNRLAASALKETSS